MAPGELRILFCIPLFHDESHYHSHNGGMSGRLFFPLCRCGFRSGGGRFIYGSLFRGRGSSPAGKCNEKGRLRHECGLETVQGREGLRRKRPSPDVDDSSWESVNLPTALSFFRKRPAAVPTTRGRYGTGKHLFLPPGWRGGETPCILRASWERARSG